MTVKNDALSATQPVKSHFDPGSSIIKIGNKSFQITNISFKTSSGKTISHDPAKMEIEKIKAIVDQFLFDLSQNPNAKTIDFENINIFQINAFADLDGEDAGVQVLDLTYKKDGGTQSITYRIDKHFKKDRIKNINTAFSAVFHTAFKNEISSKKTSSGSKDLWKEQFSINRNQFDTKQNEPDGIKTACVCIVDAFTSAAIEKITKQEPLDYPALIDHSITQGKIEYVTLKKEKQIQENLIPFSLLKKDSSVDDVFQTVEIQEVDQEAVIKDTVAKLTHGIKEPARLGVMCRGEAYGLIVDTTTNKSPRYIFFNSHKDPAFQDKAHVLIFDELNSFAAFLAKKLPFEPLELSGVLEEQKEKIKEDWRAHHLLEFSLL